MSSIQTYEQWLSEQGVSLEKLGLREVALHRAEAMTAVDRLQREGRAILGGDVYFVRGNEIEIADCNWSTDRHEHEGREAYIARSCQHTREYIGSFPDLSDCTPVFVLVG